MITNNLSAIADEACERMVLASLLANYYAIYDIENILDDNCFYNARHRAIFCAVQSVNRRGDKVDLVSVGHELAAGGSEVTPVMLAELACMTQPTTEVVKRARMLRDLAMRRRLWEIGMTLVSESSHLGNRVDEVRDHTVERLAHLLDFEANRVMTVTEAYANLRQNMIANTTIGEGKIAGSPTGFDFLDRSGGLKGGDLIVVGAETSQGKTSFATALAMSAVCHGDPVAFYSLEMSADELTARIASMQSGVSSSNILYKSLTDDSIRAIDMSMGRIDGAQLYFDVRSSADLDSICASIRRMKSRYAIKGVVVDYLQLLHVSDRRMSREQVVAQCARQLKNLARELGIWIILISQLSRDSRTPVPSMSRLRDSGQIEEAADIVLLIYRPGQTGTFPAPFADVPTVGKAMVIVGKGRNIGTGSFICGFRAVNTYFFPIADGMLREAGPFTCEPEAPAPEKMNTCPQFQILILLHFQTSRLREG